MLPPKKVATIVVFTLAITSCSADESAKSNGGILASVLSMDEVKFSSDAIYTLALDCRSDNLGGSVRSALVLSPGNGGRFVTEIFENDICSSQPSVTTVKKLGYIEGDDLDDSTELDLIEQSMLINIQSAALVEDYNERNYCEKQNYTLRKWVDTSSCSNEDYKKYTVVKVESDRLILGASSDSSEDGLTSQKRLTSIATGSEFKRIQSLEQAFE